MRDGAQLDSGIPERDAASFELPLNLGVGSYSITASLHVGAGHVFGNYDWWDGVESIQVWLTCSDLKTTRMWKPVSGCLSPFLRLTL